MSNPFIGEIRIFGGNFAPTNWALCDGQLLSIAENNALFSLLGTTYGGDGETTFALPDMRGRIPLHAGQGAGLSARLLGQSLGTEAETLSMANLPLSHTHAINGADVNADSRGVTGKVPGTARDHRYWPGGDLVAMHTNSIAVAGSGQSHDNLQPYLCLNFIIAIAGIFPNQI